MALLRSRPSGMRFLDDYDPDETGARDRRDIEPVTDLWPMPETPWTAAEDARRNGHVLDAAQPAFPDSGQCGHCRGSGQIKQDGAVFACHACSGSGYRASLTPIEYHDAMTAQMLSRFT